MIVVYPVPRGYTPEQAWAELGIFGKFCGYRFWKPRFWRPHWAIMEVPD